MFCLRRGWERSIWIWAKDLLPGERGSITDKYVCVLGQSLRGLARKALGTSPFKYLDTHFIHPKHPQLVSSCLLFALSRLSAGIYKPLWVDTRAQTWEATEGPENRLRPEVFEVFVMAFRNVICWTIPETWSLSLTPSCPHSSPQVFPGPTFFYKALPSRCWWSFLFWKKASVPCVPCLSVQPPHTRHSLLTCGFSAPCATASGDCFLPRETRASSQPLGSRREGKAQNLSTPPWLGGHGGPDRSGLWQQQKVLLSLQPWAVRKISLAKEQGSRPMWSHINNHQQPSFPSHKCDQHLMCSERNLRVVACYEGFIFLHLPFKANKVQMARRVQTLVYG